MAKSYKKQSFVDGLKYSCKNAIRANKIKLIITFVCILVAIFVGVFVALKTDCYDRSSLREIDFEDFYTGVAGSSSAFFQRCFSLLVNAAILCVLCVSPATFPLALALFVYRAYLFGLNFVLIFIFYGLGSVFTAVIIILPCQLLMLLVLVALYLVLQQMNATLRKCGSLEFSRPLFVVCMFALLLLINLAETILLALLSGRVIMVI